uniref:Secreted protein n=1 Tax=Ditylenchus dipsaci TaxID=166011 RepID=A0A915CRH8_9BILA
MQKHVMLQSFLICFFMFCVAFTFTLCVLFSCLKYDKNCDDLIANVFRFYFNRLSSDQSRNKKRRQIDVFWKS